MNDLKDPAHWETSTWALAFIMACSGGVVTWITKVRDPDYKTSITSIVELFGEIFISGFTGIAVFMALAAYDVAPGLCAAASGISGHMATRLLYLIEKKIALYFEKN
jgi:hypothetical protein